MSDNKTNVKAANANNTYETPQGVFEGAPDISYPLTPGFTPKQPVPIGGVILADAPIEYNKDRKITKVVVKNTGDRPVQIGSHFHFFEVNRAIVFDRAKAFGYHLNIPATTAVRLEPGDMREIELVSYGGKRRVVGFNGLVEGFTGQEDFPTYYPKFDKAMRKVEKLGFGNTTEEKSEEELSKVKNNTQKK